MQVESPEQVTKHRVIHIEALAPPKPQWGQTCNGCGVCCAAEPCPLGMVLSRRLSGACVALRWSAHEQRYRCGAWPAEPPRPSTPWQRWWFAMRRRWISRWIGAGQGCDCDFLASPAPRDER